METLACQVHLVQEDQLLVHTHIHTPLYVLELLHVFIPRDHVGQYQGMLGHQVMQETKDGLVNKDQKAHEELLAIL